MNGFSFLSKTLLLWHIVLVSYSANGQSAEIKISDEYLLPMVRTEPFPSSGKVNVNSPHIIWAPVFEEKKGKNTYIWSYDYLYKCRISKSKEFSDKSTITSELQEWTFFIPHEKLEKGKWYWQYAKVNKITRIEEWTEPLEFVISGNERNFVTPAPDTFISKIPKSHPRFLATKEDIGNMNFSEDDKNKFLNLMNKKIDEKLPATLIYNDRRVLDEKKKNLTPENYNRYIDKATKEKYSPQMQQGLNFIKAYLLTGEEKYKKEGLRRYFYLKEQYLDIVEKGYTNDFTTGMFFTITANIFDAFYDFLEENEREEMLNRLIKNQKETYHHFLFNSIVELMSSHRWQHHIRNFFTTSISLLHHTPEAEKWVKYVYDLWTIRAPIGSGDDGAWIAGNGYMGANLESLFVMPFLLSKYTEVDYFEDPWYKNVPSYLFLTAPVAHISGAYGDNADIKRTPTTTLIYALNQVKENNYGSEYIRLLEENGVSSRQSIQKGGNMFWFQNQKFLFSKGVKDDSPLTQSKVFPDAGMAAMHTDITDARKNLMVSFRSSPYGVTGHAHACQNTFNIQYGGDPLFFRTGYYSSWADHHSLQSYRHTRAHNGILADGIGTSFFSDGYGWISRFIEGKEISYVLGDASNAYDGTIARDEYIEQCEKWKVDLTKENGFGKPGVKQFRRHVALLRPNIIIVYDELEAHKPVAWSWLIHSKDTLASQDKGIFHTENQFGRGKLSLFSNSNYSTSVTDKFYAPAVDWLGNGAKKGIEYTNHWHGKAETTKTNGTRFLAIIEVLDKENATEFNMTQIDANNQIKVGSWSISAELDPSKPVRLQITNLKTDSGLSVGSDPLIINKKTYEHGIPGSTIVVEPDYYKEAIDKLPDAAIYK